MGKQSKTLITDVLPAYSVASNVIFPKANHIRKITLNGKAHNNNKMERLNGEMRDREKVMRRVKRKRTPIFTGYQIYHNYIRPHESLDGKTPAETCGIKVEGENKWKTLISECISTKEKLT